ncbi:unnamed protein product [Penicillium discolor]
MTYFNEVRPKYYQMLTYVAVSPYLQNDVTTNTETRCRYNPEGNEPTGEDLFVDNWDEFEVDTDEMREDFPHCFTFMCCNETLEENPHGCVTDFHREQHPEEKPLKRPRAA